MLHCRYFKGEDAFIAEADEGTVAFVILFQEHAAKFKEELAKNPNSPIRVHVMNNASWDSIILELSPEEAASASRLYDEFTQKFPRAFAEIEKSAGEKSGLTSEHIRRNVKNNMRVIIRKPTNFGALFLFGAGTCAVGYAIYRYVTKAPTKKEEAKKATA